MKKPHSNPTTTLKSEQIKHTLPQPHQITQPQSKQANHKVSVLYSTIDSTISTPLNLSNLYNRRGERLLDILITKSMLLNLSSHNKLSLQLSQISELRAAKNRFMKDRSKYMAMTQTNIATKLLLGKYTLLYKELQMKINSTKNLLEIDQGGSSKAFAIKKLLLKNGNIKKEELLQNLTHLLGLKEKMSLEKLEETDS